MLSRACALLPRQSREPLSSIGASFPRHNAAKPFFEPTAKADGRHVRGRTGSLLLSGDAGPHQSGRPHRSSDFGRLRSRNGHTAARRTATPPDDSAFATTAPSTGIYFETSTPGPGDFAPSGSPNKKSAFCYPRIHRARNAQALFGEQATQEYFRDFGASAFAVKSAHFLAELNAIHPFREGNGRAQTSFLIALADQVGHPLDEARLRPAQMLRAMVRSFDGDEQPLAMLIRRLLG